MPSRYRVKDYVSGASYHVFNRGVDRRDIFVEERDYVMFLHYLKSYLSPPESLAWNVRPRGLQLKRPPFNLHERIQLLAFCLMPNHFHLMLRQSDERAMPEFVKRLCNAYVEYFNPRCKRVGALFQGAYKAVIVNDDRQLVQLSRYIHLNPIRLLGTLGLKCLGEYKFSSYPDYIGWRDTKWLHREDVLSAFTDPHRVRPYAEYQRFVESETDADPRLLADRMIDEDEA